ncbi:hypothetical protein ETB97_000730 [Aspergillus alliaceus]|uniref:Uncharacterized protein n=1 Tax=Petromyces alliaceus TaxID=209559 RepID=A0A8H6AGG8_PETAA|nr:hypothetical protein ETB97_000730 [Aspergillus burnettii]
MAPMQGKEIFAYHDLESPSHLSGQSPQITQVKTLIKGYLKGIQFEPKTSYILKETEKPKLTVTFVHQASTSFPFEIKALCSIQGAYMFLVDDATEGLTEDLQHFGRKYTS